MNITSKSRYALKIMMDLTETQQAITHRSDIALRQGIPLDYMDQILGRLREGGLIGSVRGRSGGYRLVRPAAEISVLEIFTVVEDAFEPVQCLDGGPKHRQCVAEHFCTSKDAWGVISSAIRQALSGIILADIVSRKAALPPFLEAAPLASKVANVQECRAPRRRSGAEKSP